MREEGERIERDLVDKIVADTAKIDNNGNLLMSSIPELTTSNTKTNTTHEHERVKRFVGLLTRPLLTRIMAVGGRASPGAPPGSEERSATPERLCQVGAVER